MGELPMKAVLGLAEYNTGASNINMKAQQLYEELKHVAERLDVTVVEHSFRATGTRARSGLCIIRGRNHFIMDKHRTLREKIELLAEALASMNTENVFVMPAVREVIQKHCAGADLESEP